MPLLRSNFEAEAGPYRLRSSSLMYNTWVEQAGGRIKGSAKDGERRKALAAAAALAGASDAEVEESSAGGAAPEDDLVVPLWLLKQSNEEQVTRLFELLRKLPSAIHWFLEQIVFPTYTQHQHIKLSASGQELGGCMLFPSRVGFSGTPSDLLPLDLGRCGYEQGSDGQMLHVLTNALYMRVDFVSSGWTVDTLLERVANAEPRFHALIDSGALITGLGNKGVAQRLLDVGLGRWCEGVVFLDENDEKVILVKATGRVLKLSQCGVSVEQRFAFYDQIHTTGMDISHMLSARAALTLGKDMVFRDLAQGAYRMRGIAKGQTIALLVIPEVQQLMKRQLSKARPAAAVVEDVPVGEGAVGAPSVERAPSAADRRPQSELLQDVAAWLTLNSMRTERVQFDQLCAQNLATLWRQNAWTQLLEGKEHFKVRPECVAGFMQEKLGEAYVSNRLGKVSREHLANKSLVLYFEGKTKDEELMRAMQQAYQHFGCEEAGKESSGAPGLGLFEIIYVTAAQTASEFASHFRHMPWLSLPFTHALRREQLRHLFEISEDKDGVVLLHMDGSTITRDGNLHMKLAYRCQASLNDKQQENKHQLELTKLIEKERKQLATLEKRLQKGVVAKLERCTAQLVKQMRLKEFEEFITEQAELPADLQADLASSEAALEAARVALKMADPACLEQLRLAPEPPSEVQKASRIGSTSPPTLSCPLTRPPPRACVRAGRQGERRGGRRAVWPQGRLWDGADPANGQGRRLPRAAARVQQGARAVVGAFEAAPLPDGRPVGGGPVRATLVACGACGGAAGLGGGACRVRAGDGRGDDRARAERVHAGYAGGV